MIWFYFISTMISSFMHKQFRGAIKCKNLVLLKLNSTVIGQCGLGDINSLIFGKRQIHIYF